MARAQTVRLEQYSGPAFPSDNVKRLPPSPARPVRKVEVPRTSTWPFSLGDKALPWLLPLMLLGLWYLGGGTWLAFRAGATTASLRLPDLVGPGHHR